MERFLRSLHFLTEAFEAAMCAVVLNKQGSVLQEAWDRAPQHRLLPDLFL